MKKVAEQRVGRPMKPSLRKFRWITEHYNISDPSQIDDEFTAAMIDSGWYDGRTSFLGFVSFVDGTGKHAPEPSVPPLSDVTEVVLDDVAILGGSGFDVVAGDYVSVVFGPSTIELRSPLERSNSSVPYSQIEGLELAGGTEVSGGGMIGGGFGLEGAAVGMAAATLFNAATSKTTAFTQILITTDFSELFLLYDKADPSVLRIMLSHAFTRMRQERSNSGNGLDQ